MLTLRNVTFSYGEKTVLNDFSLSVKKGESVALMGASGRGKSTVLNLCAGLRKPQKGEVHCEAKTIGYAFQDARLFPWWNVWQNLALVLHDEDSEEAVREKINGILRFVGMEQEAERMPDELSGGMKSRIALARAFLVEPDLLLLDEPFAALDEETRQTLGGAVRARIRENGITALIVTHRIEDANLLCDRITQM